jgi:hypothetical protein
MIGAQLVDDDFDKREWLVIAGNLTMDWEARIFTPPPDYFFFEFLLKL